MRWACSHRHAVTFFVRTRSPSAERSAKSMLRTTPIGMLGVNRLDSGEGPVAPAEKVAADSEACVPNRAKGPAFIVFASRCPSLLMRAKIEPRSSLAERSAKLMRCEPVPMVCCLICRCLRGAHLDCHQVFRQSRAKLPSTSKSRHRATETPVRFVVAPFHFCKRLGSEGGRCSSWTCGVHLASTPGLPRTRHLLLALPSAGQIRRELFLPPLSWRHQLLQWPCLQSAQQPVATALVPGPFAAASASPPKASAVETELVLATIPAAKMCSPACITVFNFLAFWTPPEKFKIDQLGLKIEKTERQPKENLGVSRPS
jgi:hypothetical protein